TPGAGPPRLRCCIMRSLHCWPGQPRRTIMREHGRMATLFLALLLAAALAACGSGAREPVPEPQADIFVDPGAGSDAGSGSAEQPVRTIGQGLRLAQAGTTVFIRAGTYQDEAWPLSVPDGVSIEGQ